MGVVVYLATPVLNVHRGITEVYMDKLEELKKYVADLFGAATDKTIIEKSAVVSQKIEEVEQEQNQLRSDYSALLKDYKDVVLHSSFKPSGGDNSGGVPNSFDPDAAFKQYFIDAANKKDK